MRLSRFRCPLSLLALLLVLGAGLTPVHGEALPAVRLLLSNPAPYLGEEVIVTLEIRSAPRPAALIAPLWPQLDHCAVTELPATPPRLDDAGRPVLVQTVQRAIRPLRVGPLLIRQAGMTLQGRVEYAPPAELRVSPLPERGRPADFAGAVGSLAMQLEEGGRGTREIRLILHGSAPLADFPLPLAHPGSGERLILLNDATSGEPPGERTRTLRYLYLPGPGDRGRLTFTLPVFDPIEGSYVTYRAGIRHVPIWLRHGAYTLLGAAVLTALLVVIRFCRTPRSIEAALTHLLGRPATIIPRRQILVELGQRGAPESLLDDLQSYWAAQDHARFSGLPPSPPRDSQLLQHALLLSGLLRLSRSRRA